MAASLASPMTASSPPTATTPSSGTLMARSTPLAGDGISVSTLSVETSTRGSSAATVSPTCLSQRVTVPSVTDSPSGGRVTETDMGLLQARLRSGVGVEWLASESEVGLAHGLILRGVGVDE